MVELEEYLVSEEAKLIVQMKHIHARQGLPKSQENMRDFANSMKLASCNRTID
jgi:hypothetical protein